MKREINSNRWLHLRLTESEYQQLKSEYSKTSGSKISDFVRKKLFGKPITIVYRNRSFDDILEELAQIERNLSAAGNNFNQVTKKLHTADGADRVGHWLVTYELEKRQILAEVERAGAYIKEIAQQSELWSHE